MTNSWPLRILMLCMFAVLCTPVSQAGDCDMNAHYTLLVHGGFVKHPEKVRPEQVELIKRVVEQGRARLADGAPSLDVVVDAIVMMEDSGLLDAGKGSYFNTAGFTETDASLMDGAPAEIDKEQLAELGLELAKTREAE